MKNKERWKFDEEKEEEGESEKRRKKKEKRDCKDNNMFNTRRGES